MPCRYARGRLISGYMKSHDQAVAIMMEWKRRGYKATIRKRKHGYIVIARR